MAGSNKRKRTEFIRVRVTPAEKAEFLRRCERAKLGTGDYVRQACIDASPLRAKRQVTVHEKLLAQVLVQLGRYGNNLNQIAKKAHQLGYIDPAIKQSYQDTSQQMAEVRQLIRKALGYDS